MVKNTAKIPCNQNLGVGVVQSANCILERTKGWQTQLFQGGHSTGLRPAEKKEYL